MAWKKKRTGDHEKICKEQHRECICLKCARDGEFCCEYHGKKCNGECSGFQPEGRR